MKKLASVTNDEKIELEKLVERNNSLIELKVILKDNELIKMQEQDLEESKKNINQWWNRIYIKYNLENINQSCHFINFKDNCIYSK